MNKLKILLGLSIFWGTQQYCFCQTLSIASTPSPPCIGLAQELSGIITVTGAPSGIGDYAIWSSSGASSVSGNLTSATYSVWDVTTTTTFTFTVRYYASGGAPIGGSHSINLTVDRYENAFIEARSTHAYIPILSSDGVYNLKSLLTIPDGYSGSIEFSLDNTLHTTSPYINNTASDNTFDPSKVSILPSLYNFSYRLYYGTGCKSPWIPIVNSTIRVFDGSGALPYFIQAVSAVPICENSTDLFYFDVLSNCMSNCTLSPTYFNKVDSTLYAGPAQTTSYYSTDFFNGLRKFRFSIDPSKVNPFTFSIPISVMTACGKSQSGYIPIQLKTPLQIYGLPTFTPFGSNKVNICAASLDTMLVQGSPGGGYFKIYKYSATVPTEVLMEPSGKGSDLYPSYRNSMQDQSLQKIIPYELFADYASSDLSVKFRVVYVYSKFLSGACLDSTEVIVSFLSPNTTDYTIIAPSSVAASPLITYCY